MDPVESEIPAKLFDRSLLLRMLRYIRPYRGHMALALIIVAPLTLLSNTLPLLMRDAIDHALVPTDAAPDARWAILLRIGGLYLLIGFGAFLMRFAQGYLLAWLGQRMLFDMRADIFNKILRLPFRYFDRNPIGRLLTRVTSDVDAMQQLLTDGIIGLTTDFLMLIGVLSYMFWLNTRLALVMLLLFPPLLAVLVLLNKRVRSCHRAVRQRQSSLNAYLQEMITGMSTIQLFNREPTANAGFARQNGPLRDAFLRSVKWFSFTFPATEIMGSAAIVLLLGIGGWHILRGDGSLTIGELLAFLAYLREFFRPLDDLSEKSNLLQSAMASGERVFGLMDTPEEIEDPPQPTAPTEFRGDIAFDHVWFAYQEEHWVLRDLSVSIPAGSSLAIVGATGAGKSSLIGLLARFYDIQRGAVRVDGIDVRHYAQADLRRRIGIVLQDPFIFAGTVAENIALHDPTLSRERIEEAAKYVNAHTFIKHMSNGYDTAVMERGAGLSTGQKQLLALARAIAHNPDILLILDEATASVDTETELLIQDALKKLMKGRTSIIIAHRLSTIRHVDQILVLRQGELVEQGSHRDLLARDGYYKQLYELLGRDPTTGRDS
ncbi:MAG: ABC transporter ATP-binding protein/permease [Kiritimatiellae bacterium]|nr:ABC transporter ATP-binding protein/permease [Kiritimatiellia bacterium]